jgi:hypothetical protein
MAAGGSSIPQPGCWTATGWRSHSTAAIEAIGDVEIQDLMLHTEVNEFGNWPSVTVYFHRDRPAQPAANEFQSQQWSDS